MLRGRSTRPVRTLRSGRSFVERHILDFLLSNCTWKDGQLTAEFRQPFAMLAFANSTDAAEEVAVGADSSNGSPSRTRTYDKPVNSRLLYQLSYRGIEQRG